METYYKYFRILCVCILGLIINGSSLAQCVTPVITSIGNSGPVCEGSTLTLSAAGTLGGVSSSYIKMAGIGANSGNREFDVLFSSGDRPGEIERISEATFNTIAAGGASALRDRYDVLLFTWATSSTLNAPWSLIEDYLELGGSVFWEDNVNIVDLAPGVIGSNYDGGYGCGYELVSPAPFPELVANGVNSCFANHHLQVTSWPSWMRVYIKGGIGENLAIAGIHPTGRGRFIVQGPDQDYHALRGGSGASGNQYQILLNQLDFLIAEQTGISWTGPNGFTSNAASPVITNITSANAGVYTATLTNISGGGCSVSATTIVSVISAPTATITPTGSTNLCPGSTVQLTANDGIAYLWSTGETTKAITVGVAGDYTVQVTNANTCSATSATVTIQLDNSYCNSTPVADAKPLTISADNSCLGSAAAADFDDGSTDVDGDALTFSISPVGPYSLGTTNVVLTVTDSKGASSSVNTSITVTNNAPTLDAIIPITINPVPINTAFSASATFTDNNLQSGIWTWGDGTSSGGVISGTTISGSRTYNATGVYTIGLEVKDACNVTDQNIYQYVVVYDPSGGFVTGGGWITSPQNTQLYYMQESGRANFGFVSKYVKGATKPTGETNFQFQTANLHFLSSSYEWLVVSGATARYKGVGTINGSGNYGFIISAVDGQVTGGGGSDKFRIKIWDKNNNDVVVYDNNLAATGDDALAETIISGGSIVVHEAKKATSSKTIVAATEPQEGQFYSYPTAFSSKTTIAFTLDKAEEYVLEVFDLKGALVKRLAAGAAEANKLYEVELDGADMREGVYITRLSTSSNVQSLKTVLRR